MRGVAALVFAIAAGGCSGGGSLGPAEFTFQEGFEGGLTEWRSGFELPEDPNNPGHVVAWSIDPSALEAAEGSWSARYVLDGSQDDGTIWLERAFDMEPGASYRVDVRLKLWSETESFNILAAVAVFAGAAPPVTESQFDVSKQANLAAGWHLYSYTLQAAADSIGRLWIAVGITALWETPLEYFLDDLVVELRRTG